jgi:hypothetical protein
MEPPSFVNSLYFSTSEAGFLRSGKADLLMENDLPS